MSVLLSKSAKKGFMGFWLMQTLLIASCLTAFAQGGHRVSGTVTDAGNAPIIGATVLEQGANRGVTTDAQGKFSMTVSSSDAVLSISYIGMETETIPVGNRSTINVTLSEETINVGDVVVTALGIKRDAKALGYAVSQVGNETLTAGREQNVMSALMGKVAGVDISTSTAGPTGSTRVLIRGNSQLSGSNLPLYVIDGLPVDNSQIGDEVGRNGGYDYGDVLSSINPDDIESISVLKGPSASALYGSMASNGVILITTKQASQSKRLGVEVSSNVSITNLLSKFDDYQRVYGMGSEGLPPLTHVDAMSATQKAWGGKLDPNIQTYIYNGEMRDYGNKNNNVLSFFDTGVTLNNSVAVSRNVNNTSFRLSISDMRNWDIVPQSTLERTSINFRGSTKIHKNITIEAQATYTMEKVENRPALADASSNIGNAIIGIAPNFDQRWLKTDYKDQYDQYYNWNGSEYRLNPYWVINEMENESRRNRLIGQARFTWDLTSYLKLSLRGGLDTYQFRATEYTPISTPRVLYGTIAERSMDVTQSNLEAMLTYSQTFGDFDLTAFVGGNLLQYRNEGFNLGGSSHAIPTLIDINGYETLSVNHTLLKKEVRSLFGQASLGYKGTYYIDATLRNDVSSALPKDNRSYIYPSVSGSLIFSNLFKHGNWFSFGKVRASWANVGGDTGPYRLSLDYGLKNYTINGQGIGTVSTSTIPNEFLKPTSTYSTEVGLDVRFLQNRLSLDLTLYTQTTKDQIMSLPVSRSTGYQYAVINAGEIRNKGIEITLGATPVDKAFKWNTTVTYSRNLNKVVDLHPDVPNYELGAARWAGAYIYAMENEPYGVIVGKKILRAPDGQMILSEAGLPQVEENFSILGNGNYDFVLGWSHNFSYKNFGLSVVMDARFGADLYSMSMMQAHSNGISKNTLEGREGWYASEQQRRSANATTQDWKPTGGYLAKGVFQREDENGNTIYVQNTDTYVDPYQYWFSFQDTNPSAEPYIVDASYIKLREMSLSYSFPQKILRKISIDNLTLSIYGRNLWTILSHVDNIDPESTYNNGNGKGFEYGSLPSRRTFGFGLNVKF